jgi:hypothetical protein
MLTMVIVVKPNPKDYKVFIRGASLLALVNSTINFKASPATTTKTTATAITAAAAAAATTTTNQTHSLKFLH